MNEPYLTKAEQQRIKQRVLEARAVLKEKIAEGVAIHDDMPLYLNVHTHSSTADPRCMRDRHFIYRSGPRRLGHFTVHIGERWLTIRSPKHGDCRILLQDN